MAGLDERGRDVPKLSGGSFKEIFDRMKGWFKGNF
jgi:cell division protein FtsA